MRCATKCKAWVDFNLLSLSAKFIIPIGNDCWVSSSGQGSTHESKLWRCWLCCSQATATRELGSGQMLILEGACRRALCDGGYSVRGYQSKHLLSRGSMTILNHRLLLWKKSSKMTHFLRLWKLKWTSEKQRKFNSDGNESHQDGGSDEQSEDEVASSGLNYIFWIEELRNRPMKSGLAQSSSIQYMKRRPNLPKRKCVLFLLLWNE